MKHAYLETRSKTEEICEPLEVEDMVIQTCPEVSPPKWHLAHTTWFFEKFILQKYDSSYRVFNPKFSYLFNSYYKTVGQHWQRVDRGKLSRPTVKTVMDYRKYVDECLVKLLNEAEDKEILKLVELGIQHEQQHQELLLMDIKHILSTNIDRPAYLERSPMSENKVGNEEWFTIAPGVYEFGTEREGFHYDNEGPVHKRSLIGAEVSKILVTNGQFVEFMQDGGYERPELWLSLGWDWVQENNIRAPLYWNKSESGWKEFTLHGEVELNPIWPVQHISLYEADAYARWRGVRLPSEFELELLLKEEMPKSSNKDFHGLDPHSSQYNLWSWTSTQYQAYPGYVSYEGSLGEYNQKFMCNQFVLRGGSYGTPAGHLRATYRNFFEPWQRWMFSGLRLAKNLQ
ncbi:MAG: sulfatase maturase [Halobacteriovoraceae bacterium]|nr:sulfatase maturase [Halobacteriovoraceae bacterium]|tara:strand:- start:219851 stop:221050 length:1200 start_codon:yes stop_codon:yes gene_type:complete